MSGASGRGATSRATSRLELDERWARAAWAFLTEPRDAGVDQVAGGVRGGRGAGAAAGRAAVVARAGGTCGCPSSTSTAWLGRRATTGCACSCPATPSGRSGSTAWASRRTACSCVDTPTSAALVERSVAIVGSRAATEYGLRVAADLADGLAMRGFTVVSGAAYGVDSAAHRAALAADGPDRRGAGVRRRPGLPHGAPGHARPDRRASVRWSARCRWGAPRTGRGSSHATGSSPCWRGPRSSSRPTCGRARSPRPRPRGSTTSRSAPCPGRSRA